MTTKSPRQTSPHRFIQEELRNEPWKLLVACIMLNQTAAVQVRAVMPEFFGRWPTAHDAAHADQEEMAAVIRPLGLHNRRASTIRKMSSAYLDGVSPGDLPGVGKYALDSYRMFVDPGVLVDDVEDKELRRYLEWCRNEKARGI